MDFATLVTDCEPVTKAQAAAAAGTPAARPEPGPPRRRPEGVVPTPRRRKAPPAAPAAPAPTPVPAPAPEPPPPVFVGGKPRSEAFPLDYPLSYDGRVYDAITLRRPTQGEVGAFMDALLEGGSAPFPVFYTPDGSPVPQSVIERLDQDDSDRIMGRLSDFLPVRLQRLAEALSDRPSIPPSGETTAPTSLT